MTTQTDQEVMITRVFNASPEQVFDAWASTENLHRWYAPPGCGIRFEKLDFRTGGSYLSCILTPSGHECWCKGNYHEVQRPSRIVFTMEVADSAGNSKSPVEMGMDPQWPQETVLTVTFEPQETQTLLTLHQTVSESLAKKTGAHPSWLLMLDRLSEILAR